MGRDLDLRSPLRQKNKYIKEKLQKNIMLLKNEVNDWMKNEGMTEWKMKWMIEWEENE